jgi:hypothetical protein
LHEAFDEFEEFWDEARDSKNKTTKWKGVIRSEIKIF